MEDKKYLVMLDLETGSTHIPKAVVLAIGACLFEINDTMEISYNNALAYPNFYKSVKVKSQLKKHRDIDPGTI